MSSSPSWSVRERPRYCFEHATLFSAALERLGYTVERRLGEVSNPNERARTPASSSSRSTATDLLCDPRVRGEHATQSIQLVDGAEDDYGNIVLTVPRGA